MIKKSVALYIIFSIMLSCILSSCSNTDQNTSNGDTGKSTEITGKDTEASALSNNKKEDSASKNIDEQGKKDIPSDTEDLNNDSIDKTKKEENEKESAEYDEPEDKTMDYIDRLNYDRSRLLAKTEYYDSLDNSCPNTWCFERKKNHEPSGTYENFKIKDYQGVYLKEDVSADDKVIYLTFDCGYPSDLTVKILDTLAKHNAKASFFVTKMYLEECAEYAKRMKQEGHMVCNHTVTHTDLLKKSVEGIAAEIFDVAEYFYEMTGYEFDPYLRTPTGSYSKRLMSIIRDAGYLTVFWSIAYGDYDPKNQPEPGYVTNHFATYHHNGAIALMHNDSPSNANELDAVLTLLENEGYRFGLLNELDY